MCSAPKIPDAPDPLPPAPTPPPMLEPEAPVAAPQMATGPEDATKIKKKSSKRKQQQQAASGTAALRIPLNTGSAKGAAKAGSLNIPK